MTAEGTASVRCAIPAGQTVFAGLPATMDLALGQVEDALVIPVTAVQAARAPGTCGSMRPTGQNPRSAR